jgi:hypothetical protein
MRETIWQKPLFQVFLQGEFANNDFVFVVQVGYYIFFPKINAPEIQSLPGRVLQGGQYV